MRVIAEALALSRAVGHGGSPYRPAPLELARWSSWGAGQRLEACSDDLLRARSSAIGSLAAAKTRLNERVSRSLAQRPLVVFHGLHEGIHRRDERA